MKQSHYNYFIPLNDKLYVMNGLTEKFFSVNPTREQTYRELLANPNLYEDDFASFYIKMKDGGFVLEDSSDEMELVNKKFEMLRKPTEYSLMVLPTYACNLRCWYCIQKHENVNLSDEIFERLKKHIDKVVKRKDILNFKLWWFGGEPLIQYDKVLGLNLYAKQRCEENGLLFSANITTNSTLLTPERVDALRESGVDHYQISIDGPKELHDKVKVLPNRSAFEHAMSIIDYIAQTISCTLRFNYTKDTLHPEKVFNDVNERLSETSRKNISFLLYKVWQESEADIDDSQVSKLYSLSQQHHLHPRLETPGLCYADQKNFFCVFPNGKVGKCDNHGIESGVGQLDCNGDILWPENLAFDKPVLLEDNNECACCSYLPLCWGPCASKREQASLNGTKYPCIYPDKERRLHLAKNRLIFLTEIFEKQTNLHSPSVNEEINHPK